MVNNMSAAKSVTAISSQHVLINKFGRKKSRGPLTMDQSLPHTSVPSVFKAREKKVPTLRGSYLPTKKYGWSYERKKLWGKETKEGSFLFAKCLLLDLKWRLVLICAYVFLSHLKMDLFHLPVRHPLVVIAFYLFKDAVSSAKLHEVKRKRMFVKDKFGRMCMEVVACFKLLS
jgi:hypothetical protein